MPINFTDFALDVFPDLDPRVLTKNPGRVSAEAQAVLEQVSCSTGVPMSWLTNLSQLVLRGLAGCQCLWFLHGARGHIEVAAKPPSNLGPYIAQMGVANETIVLPKQQAKDPSLVSSYVTGVDWGSGLVTIEQGFRDKPPKIRQVKLGKYLRQLNKEMVDFVGVTGFFDELIHEFETRQLTGWDWRISAHPYDVLTMSYRRPWTSCMRPPDPEADSFDAREAGEAEFGPITDMAAGSAVLFWHRPGASVACGRVILRPVLTHGLDPAINVAPKLYGCGPDPNIEQIAQMIAEATGTTMMISGFVHCTAGTQGRALSRWIYDDTEISVGGGECIQDRETYDAAYEALRNAPWPEPKLDVGAVRGAAQQALDSYEVIGAEELAHELLQRLLDGLGNDRENLLKLNWLAAKFKLAWLGGVTNTDEIDYELGLGRDMLDTVHGLMKEHLIEYMEAIRNREYAMVIALAYAPDDVAGVDYEKIGPMAERYHGYTLPSWLEPYNTYQTMVHVGGMEMHLGHDLKDDREIIVLPVSLAPDLYNLLNWTGTTWFQVEPGVVPWQPLTDAG